MRILTPIFTVLLLLSVVGCSEDVGEPGASPPNTSWHALKQSERNEKIIKVALADYRENVGESCKEWIRDVVEKASNGDVIIPENNNNADGWVIDPLDEENIILSHQHSSPALLNTVPGAIVQIHWKTGLYSKNPKYNVHTAIVLYVLPEGVVFIESNFDNTPADNSDAIVDMRFQSELDFGEKVQAYSVYYIR